MKINYNVKSFIKNIKHIKIRKYIIYNFTVI